MLGYEFEPEACAMLLKLGSVFRFTVDLLYPIDAVYLAVNTCHTNAERRKEWVLGWL